MRKTHVPGEDGITLCGRLGVETIDLVRSPIDSATCRTCHVVDERRQLDAYLEEIGHAALYRAVLRLPGEDQVLVGQWRSDWERVAKRTAGLLEEHELESELSAHLLRWLERHRARVA